MTAPNGRDGSVGPGIMRRRSDSTNTAGDYDADVFLECDESLPELQIKELPFNTPSYVTSAPGPMLQGAHVSTASSSTLVTGAPTVSSRLVGGTPMRKITKKNKAKDVTLQLQADKLVWDQSRADKCIHVDSIRDIRTGGDVRQYRLDFGFSEADESRWFSIMYAVDDRSKIKMMHLIAPDAETFDEWTQTLDAIGRHRQFAMVALMNFSEDALREYWQKECAQHNQNHLDLDGVVRMCRNLHINASPLFLQGALYFVGASMNKICFDDFLRFVKHISTRADVYQIYCHVAADPEKGISLAEFLNFIGQIQREDVESRLLEWRTVFARYSSLYRAEADEDKAAKLTKVVTDEDDERMSSIAFASFLTSFENSPIKEAPAECTLDRPVNEYYISSSHNTYLMGRQIYGESTTEGYIMALVNGCRCVEVDCWDGPNGQPVVNHGRTFTSPISFQEVITIINKYAFHKTRLPLWISFEVHCSPEQQVVIAQICRATFGSRLVTEPLNPDSTKLPSPSDLVGCILVKVKQPKWDNSEVTSPVDAPAAQATTGRKRGSSLTSATQPPVIPELSAISYSVPQTPALTPTVSSRSSMNAPRVNTIAEDAQDSTGSSSSSSSSSSDAESGSERPPVHHQKSFTPRIVPSLGVLGVYCAGVKFKGFETPEARQYNHIFSFMEASFARYSRFKEDRKAMDRHNMRYLMRVYPNQTRITSNNFDPLLYWRRGVQMAALNWQTFDLGQQLNRAMFEGGTDTSGYVLKPRELREIQVMPEGWQGKRERKRVKFEIEVVSARQLMRPSSLPANKPMNPYVEIEVFHSSDKRDKKESISSMATMTDTPLKVQTQPVTDNGFNPNFWKGRNTFKFQVTTKYPELVFVRWVVKLAPSDETYAVYVAKLSNLKEGYRTLPLWSPKTGDQYLFSTLFCRIAKNEPESIMLDCHDDHQPDRNKLRGINLGRNPFGRSTSPKAAAERAQHHNQPSSSTTATPATAFHTGSTTTLAHTLTLTTSLTPTTTTLTPTMSTPSAFSETTN
jgi:phosphatidylinositol phospholipase C delta